MIFSLRKRPVVFLTLVNMEDNEMSWSYQFHDQDDHIMKC